MSTMLPASATASTVTEMGESRTKTPQTNQEPIKRAGHSRAPPNSTPTTPTPTASHGAATDMTRNEGSTQRCTNSTVPMATATYARHNSKPAAHGEFQRQDGRLLRMADNTSV